MAAGPDNRGHCPSPSTGPGARPTPDALEIHTEFCSEWMARQTGSWDSEQKGPKAVGRCDHRAVEPWRTLLQAPFLLKQMWFLLTAARNSLFLQYGQGRAPLSRPPARVTRVHKWLHWCVLEGACTPL